MELEVKKPVVLDDGTHIGVVVAVEYRDAPYKYTDVIIEIDGMRIKYGCPTQVTEDSRLGKLLKKFGADMRVGSRVDPEKVLVGKKCVFMTMTEETDRGSFARIVIGSLKPFVELEGGE